jgi:hypothetical protein
VDRDLVRGEDGEVVPDARLPPDAAWNRDVDERRRAGAHLPVRAGRGVAQRRARAGAQDCREGSSLRPQRAVAEGIDTATHDDKRSRPDAGVDGARADAQIPELRPRDETVLALRQHRHATLTLYVNVDVELDGHAPMIARRMSRVGDGRADSVTTR